MNINTPAPYDQKLKAFERSCVEISCIIREAFAHHNVGHFTFTVKASGRTAAGSSQLEFTIAGDYNHSSVTGSTIRPIMEEFFHRLGFDNLHAPLELPRPGDEPQEEDQQAF